MSQKQLEQELHKHLEEVISSRKISLEGTEQTAHNLWSLICSTRKKYSSKRIIIQHYSDGKVITTVCTDRMTSTPGGKVQATFVDEKLIDYWPDFELLPILSIIAENSDIKGKCRLCETGTCKELHLDFK